MNQHHQELQSKIEKLRQELYNLVKLRKNFRSEDVLKKSVELDRLLNKL